jgi:CRISPR-associated protein Csm1
VISEHHADERHIREVVSLGDHLRTDHHVDAAVALPSATRISVDPGDPARLSLLQTGGTDASLSWPLVEQAEPDADAIIFPRRFATDEDGSAPASLTQLGERAEGACKWGVLRGDVDLFAARLRAATSVEDHLQLSAMFKQFFAGELALQCTYPEFWRTVGLLSLGGDSFAVVGAWDALILLARELHRLFEKFVEGTASGVEGKTITMALSIAPDPDSSLASVFGDAGVQLRSAKIAQPGGFQLFGRLLEWPRIADAEELKVSLVRLARDFDLGSEFVHDLASVYRESFSMRSARRGKSGRLERPWRTYMRVSEVLPHTRGKDSLNLRNVIITNLLGKKIAGSKLRPSARVGLEWARLAAEQETSTAALPSEPVAETHKG